MAKFKKGDRVRSTQKENANIPFNAGGVVDQDGSAMPYVIWDEVTDFAKAEFPEINRFAQFQQYLEPIQQVNPNDPLGIIGKKMRGFKFESGRYNYLSYHTNMNKLIGIEGEIVNYREEYDCYNCKFHDDWWHYPADLIMQHIVDTPQDNQQDTPQELTILEKFEQGWHITDSYGDKMIAVYKAENSDKILVEWFSGAIGTFDLQDLNGTWLTCTPPKERKKLYLYRSGASCGFSVTSDGWGAQDFIAEIHLEKTDGKWNVIK